MSPLEIPENKSIYGLWYRPTKVNKRKVLDERRKKNLTPLEGNESRLGTVLTCDIGQSFQSVRWVNIDQVTTVEDVNVKNLNFVHPYHPNMKLNGV